MQYKGLTLDKFQEDAIAAIESNKSVIVSAPTGSGKTLIADYIIERDIKKGLQVVYTAPIKALSNQKYKEFSRDYGEKNIGLLTGDVVRNSSAPILIMTTEIYRNMVLADDPAIREVSYVIFDEIHYINDVERGYVWEESIIFSPPHIRMLCLSATIPNADEFARWIAKIKGHEVVVVQHKNQGACRNPGLPPFHGQKPIKAALRKAAIAHRPDTRDKRQAANRTRSDCTVRSPRTCALHILHVLKDGLPAKRKGASLQEMVCA
ncbi:DEAD/DEAH box helicase [Candidatus Woesearchaeota archaeon]|nr:DEAD/DEAH box helicase [Candidatus Woesearchaeota archaeon]